MSKNRERGRSFIAATSWSVHAYKSQTLKWGGKEVGQSGAACRPGRRGAQGPVRAGDVTRQAVWAAVKMPRILSHLSTADWLVRRAGPCQKFTNPNVWIARGVDNSSRAYTTSIRPRGPRQVRQQPTAAKMPTINVDKYALFEELGEQ